MPDDKKKAPILPAATVLLLRESEGELQVFMVVRHHQIDFASGALVFPGGKVDTSHDTGTIHELCDGSDDIPDDLLAFRVAAIREAFEECGVLLARDAATGELVTGARALELDAYREQLVKGDITMLNFAREHGLTLAVDLMVPFAHWITPDMMPKRFDTHFFLAVAPEDHIAAHDGSENVDSVWINPSQAMNEAEEGKWTIIFPTLMNVKKLAESATVEGAMNTARTSKIVTVLPVVKQGEKGPVLTIPAEAGYGITEQSLEGMAG